LQRITITARQIQADQLTLTQAQQHYLRRVLRLVPGDQFQAIDGQGKIYLAVLQTTGAQVSEQLESYSRELPITINLVLAMPKNGLDDVIRVCTELGVTAIYPVTSDRTIPKPSNSKQQRWQKIAQEAAEQCERLIIPIIHEPQPWVQICPPATAQKLICAARGRSPHLCNWDISAAAIWLAIGPEGGWTDRELAQALEQGWRTVSLGTRILRAITAPMVAMSIVSSLLESSSFPPEHP
jgi:16S rRNA (uracil1498-N3)-methyltransferase